jgi:hypothetical protein
MGEASSMVIIFAVTAHRKQFVRRVIKLTVVIIMGYHYYQLLNNFSNILCSKLSPYVDEIIGDHQCEF